jgi:cell division inhibitor SulA
MLQAENSINPNVTIPFQLYQPEEVNVKPSTGLAGKITEIVLQNSDVEQMTMLLPLLAQLSKDDRWFAWIAPPATLPKALLEAAGIDLNKIMLLQPDQNHSTYDLACQALQAGTCHAVITWPGQLDKEELTDLEAAARNGESHGILIRGRND